MSSLTPRQKLDRLEPLTLSEFAALAGCSLRQVRKWCNVQDPPVLPVFRVGKHRRIRAEDAKRVLVDLGAVRVAS